MRRLGSWLFNAFTALSVLLAVLACVLWEVSFHRYDTFTLGWNRPRVNGLASGHIVRLLSGRGDVSLLLVRVTDGNEECYRSAERVQDDAPRMTFGRARLYTAAWLGVRRSSQDFPLIGHGGDVYAPLSNRGAVAQELSTGWFGLSYGLVAAIFAALPLARAVRSVRLVRRRRATLRVGCCPRCSYDLTANVSGVCPECGTALRQTERA